MNEYETEEQAKIIEDNDLEFSINLKSRPSEFLEAYWGYASDDQRSKMLLAIVTGERWESFERSSESSALFILQNLMKHITSC